MEGGEQGFVPPTVAELRKRDNLGITERGLLDDISDLQNVTQETKGEVAERVRNVAGFAGDFDYVMVTGGSRKVSRSLLQAAGVDPHKFIGLDRQANILAYKEVDEATSALTDQQRIDAVRAVMAQRGIGPDSKVSICVVDDHVGTGEKANKILRIMAQMPELTNYSYATFSAPVFTHAAESVTGVPVQQQTDKIFDTPDLAKHFHIPPSADTFYDTPDFFFAQLSASASILSPGHSKQTALSPDVLQAARVGLRDILKDTCAEVQGSPVTTAIPLEV